MNISEDKLKGDNKSNIRINRTWKANTNNTINDNLAYDNMLNIDMHEQNADVMPNNINNEMIKIIDKLSKNDHIVIYKFVADEYGKKIFSTNTIGIYFSLKQLDNKMKWKLYKLVKMLYDNYMRTKIQEKAYEEHKSIMDNDLNPNVKSTHIHTKDTSSTNEQSNTLDCFSFKSNYAPISHSSDYLLPINMNQSSKNQSAISAQMHSLTSE